MAFNLDMDTSVVSECANNILKATDDNSNYKNIINDMEKLINDLNLFWVSNSQVKTANELIESLNNLKFLQSDINATAKLSLDISHKRDELEKKISELINNL